MERLLLGLEAIEDGGGGGGGGDCQQHTQGDAKDHPAGVISHKPPLMFIVFLPAWRKTIGWRLFANSSVLSRTFDLLVRDTNGGDGDTGVDENEDGNTVPEIKGAVPCGVVRYVGVFPAE